MDAGTSSVHCLAATADGKTAHYASRLLSYHIPPELHPLGREIEPEDAWRAIVGLLEEGARAIRERKGELAAIAVTSQREALVFLDRQGRELYVGPNLDLRAATEGMAMDEEAWEEIYRATGHLPSFFFGLAKLRWFQNNAPDVYERLDTVFTLADWIAFRLTGERASEVALAGEAGLLEMGSRRWALGLARKLGLRDDCFPGLVPSGTVVGRVAGAVAPGDSMLAGAPVVIAGPDTQCGLLGMGIVARGEVGVVAGWSAPAQMVTERLVLDPQFRLWSGCHVVDGKWVLEGNAGNTGDSYQWLAQLLSSGGEDGSVAALDSLAGSVEPFAAPVYAFLGPRPMDARNMGLHLGGLLFPVPLALDDMGAGHLARAALESIAFSVRSNVELLADVSGAAPNRFGLGGGMARSGLFCQMLATVLGRQVMVATEPSRVSSLGAALCGAKGAGLYKGLREAAVVGRRLLRPVDPDGVLKTDYDERFRQWRLLLEELDRLKGKVL